jgi:hypothetical protein
MPSFGELIETQKKLVECVGELEFKVKNMQVCIAKIEEKQVELTESLDNLINWQKTSPNTAYMEPL